MTRKNRRHTSRDDRRQIYQDDHPFLSWLLPFFLFDVFFGGPAMTETSTTDWTTEPTSNQTEKLLPSENREDAFDSQDNLTTDDSFGLGESFSDSDF